MLKKELKVLLLRILKWNEIPYPAIYVRYNGKWIEGRNRNPELKYTRGLSSSQGFGLDVMPAV